MNMKKKLVLAFLLCCIQPAVFAADLMEVYCQAVVSDPTFQQAIAQQLVTRENVPITLAPLLPSAGIGIVPTISKSHASGPAAFLGSQTARGYTSELTLSQTIFDFAQFYGFSGARSLAKGADATLSAASQALIIRTAQAYFKILEDQDNLVYIISTRTAFEKQLDQVKQQYNVGLKTVTDVYTAEAAYQTSVAATIEAENTLAVDKENLRAITGVYYPKLARLRDDFPLVKPQPANIDDWVTIAGKQNWSIKAAQYSAQAARKNVSQQFAGNLPTLNVEGTYQNNYTYNVGGDPSLGNVGSARILTSTAMLNLNIPIVEGGLVTAQTKQAKYNYQLSLQQLEFTLRNTLYQTRQNYLGVLAGISKIAADKESIKSNASSVAGMEAGYQVGTEILVNVLNQQKNLFLAQKQYATDRYAYVNNFLALKQAAGTLSQCDLEQINKWLEKRTG